MEAIWELSGVCWKFSRGCLCPEGFSKLSGFCLEGVYKVFEPDDPQKSTYFLDVNITKEMLNIQNRQFS